MGALVESVVAAESGLGLTSAELASSELSAYKFVGFKTGFLPHGDADGGSSAHFLADGRRCYHRYPSKPNLYSPPHIWHTTFPDV